MCPTNLALFILRLDTHYADSQLISFTLIDIFSWLGGQEVTLQTAVREVPGFYVCFFVVLLSFYLFLFKTHYLSWHFVIPFAMLINLVYLTYENLWPKGYQDTPSIREKWNNTSNETFLYILESILHDRFYHFS